MLHDRVCRRIVALVVQSQAEVDAARLPALYAQRHHGEALNHEALGYGKLRGLLEAVVAWSSQQSQNDTPLLELVASSARGVPPLRLRCAVSDHKSIDNQSHKDSASVVVVLRGDGRSGILHGQQQPYQQSQPQQPQ